MVLQLRLSNKLSKRFKFISHLLKNILPLNFVSHWIEFIVGNIWPVVFLPKLLGKRMHFVTWYTFSFFFGYDFFA